MSTSAKETCRSQAGLQNHEMNTLVVPAASLTWVWHRFSIVQDTTDLHKAEPSLRPVARSALRSCMCQPHSAGARLERRASWKDVRVGPFAICLVPLHGTALLQGLSEN